MYGASTACLGIAVHSDVAALDEKFGVAAGAGGAGELEERAQRQRPVDGDLAHCDRTTPQPLRRIGMMR
jgi:hypothetical protein